MSIVIAMKPSSAEEAICFLTARDCFGRPSNDEISHKKPLREFRVFAKIGFAFFYKGVFTFFAFST
jgi:hypothetical protein